MKPLINLKEAHFENNVCINSFAVTQNASIELQTELGKKCYNVNIEMTYQKEIHDLKLSNELLALEIAKLKTNFKKKMMKNFLKSIKT